MKMSIPRSQGATVKQRLGTVMHAETTCTNRSGVKPGLGLDQDQQ